MKATVVPTYHRHQTHAGQRVSKPAISLPPPMPVPVSAPQQQQPPQKWQAALLRQIQEDFSQQLSALRRDQTELASILLDFLNETEDRLEQRNDPNDRREPNDRAPLILEKLDTVLSWLDEQKTSHEELSTRVGKLESASCAATLISGIKLLQKQVGRIEQDVIPTLRKNVDEARAGSQWIYATVQEEQLPVRLAPREASPRVLTLKKGETILCTQNVEQDGNGNLWVQVRSAEHPSTVLWTQMALQGASKPCLGSYRICA